MRVEVLRPSELGAAEVAAWRRMQHQTPALASPFLAPEFTCAVGRARDDAFVAVLEEPHGIVGFFPFQRRRRLRVGVPIGAGISDVQGIVHAPGATWSPQELLAACALDVWEFDHLLAAQQPFAPYRTRAARSPIVDLTDGYAAYLEHRMRASERVRVAMRKARKLAREVGDVRFEFDARDPDGLRRVLGWKSAQYRRTGRADRLASPWIRQVVEELSEERAADCAGTLSLVWAGDRLVSGHFGLRSTHVLASWFPAYDVEAARYSPGWLLFMRIADAAAGAGLQQLDFGKGDEDYKQSLKTGDLELAEGWVQRRSLRALARAVEREPRRRMLQFVLDRPALRRAARRCLRHVGRLRG